MMVLEERVELSLLMDIYGELLTDKQKDVLALYFNEDLSLGEIAEITGNSRQAAFDIIKRCSNTLFGYENKLHLLSNALESKNKKEDALSKLRLIIKNSQGEIRDNLVDILEDIEKL